MGGPGSRSKSSSSAGVDFLNLCKLTVRIVEDFAGGTNLLNLTQCHDLSLKLSKTTLNIRQLASHSGAPAELFQPALEKLYRHLEKAKMLVIQCGDKDWCTAAVFQGQNEHAFREILLDLGFCYNAIYEQAKSWKEDSNSVLPEDLRKSFVFKPAKDDDVLQDQEDLLKRLEGLVNHTVSNNLMDRLLPNKKALKQCLARYLLVKLNFAAKQSQVSTLETSSEILWKKRE